MIPSEIWHMVREPQWGSGIPIEPRYLRNQVDPQESGMGTWVRYSYLTQDPILIPERWENIPESYAPAPQQATVTATTAAPMFRHCSTIPFRESLDCLHCISVLTSMSIGWDRFWCMLQFVWQLSRRSARLEQISFKYRYSERFRRNKMMDNVVQRM